jgi:hypothetical protein
MTSFDQWANLIAHAWKHKNVMDNLQSDPKAEIERLKGTAANSPKKTDADYIDPQLIANLGSSNSDGYMPLGGMPKGLDKLDQKDLVKFIKENMGIFGIMRWCYSE